MNVNNNNDNNDNNKNDILNNNFINNIDFKYKCDNIKHLVADIYKEFKSIGLFDELTFYLDNLSTINYLFSNDTNKIMLFCTCVDNTKKFILIQNKIKETLHKNNNDKFKYVSMVSNYFSSINSNIETNTNRQYDNLSFIYKFSNIDKEIGIIIYFFNSKSFFNEQRFNNLICEDFFYTCKKIFISSIYYCLNDEVFYLIDDNGSKNMINDINKIINLSIHNESKNIIDNLNTFTNDYNYYNEINQELNINENILLSNPVIFFDIFSYYLMTQDSRLKNNLSHIIWIYSNNKNIKKKFKKYFDYNDVNFNIKLYILVNLIKNFSLNQICIDTIKEFPAINKILFGLSDELNFFDIEIYNSFEIYVIAILFNIHKVFKTKTYLNYINKNCSCSDNLDFDFSSVFDNKLKLLRNIKKNIFSIHNLNIPSKYYHFNKINCLCEILYVLLYSTKELNSNIEILKLSYVFKKFYFLKIDDFNFIFDIYNQIIKNIGLGENYFITGNNYFYTMYSYKSVLIEMEAKLLSELTTVNKNYLCSIDSIDIYDKQDAIYLIWELLYLNRLDLTDENFLKINLDDYHNSILANIRSNKLLSNNSDSDSNNLNTLAEYNDGLNGMDLNEITKKYKKKYIINDSCDEIIDLNNIVSNDTEDDFDIENNIIKIFNTFIEDCNSNSNSNYILGENNNYDEDDIGDGGNNGEDNENISDYFVDHDNQINNKKSKNIFNKFSNSIDDIISKINYFCSDELSDTSDSSNNYYNCNITDLNDLDDLDYLDDFDKNTNDLAENFISNSKKELKYQKYKNKYLRLKNIHQIIQNDYFNINIFIDQINLGFTNNKIFDLILDYYELSNCVNNNNHNKNDNDNLNNDNDNDNLNNDNLNNINVSADNTNNIDNNTNNIDNNDSCIINLNDINYNYIDLNNINPSFETNNDEIKEEIQTILYDLIENIEDKIKFNNNEICVQVLDEIIDKIEFGYLIQV